MKVKTFVVTQLCNSNVGVCLNVMTELLGYFV